MKVEPPFGYWLAGFADGEGCFWIHRMKHGAFYAPQFKIKLRADDKPTLIMCRDTLGIGNLYDHKPEGNAKPTSSWQVQSAHDAAILVSVFDVHPLRSKKARDYEIWREAVALVPTMPRGHRYRGPRDWSRMLALKLELESTRKYPAC